MARLPAPSGWRVDRERRMDEPGNSRRLRSVGVPLQGVCDEHLRLERHDYVVPMTAHQWRCDQNPVDVVLLHPTRRIEIGLLQLDRRWRDARGLQDLALSERPGRKEALSHGTAHVVSEFGQGHRRSRRESMAGPERDHQWLGAEHFTDDALRLGNQAARDRYVDLRVGDGTD